MKRILIIVVLLVPASLAIGQDYKLCEQITRETVLQQYKDKYFEEFSQNTHNSLELKRRVVAEKLACMYKELENINASLNAENVSTENREVLQSSKTELEALLDKTQKESVEANRALLEGEELNEFDRLKRDEKQAKLYSKTRAFPIVTLGTQLSPEYDDDGNNGGFSEKTFAGSLSIDTRWEKSRQGESFFGKSQALHFTAFMDFGSEPLLDCSKIQDQAEQDDCVQNDNYIPSSFNDIDDSLTAGAKLTYNFAEYFDSKFVVGLTAIYGFKTRDKIGDDGDSTNAFSGVGLRFAIQDFKELGGKAVAKNGLPAFFIEVDQIKYSDGFREIESQKARTRTVVDAGIRMGEHPIYIGLKHNGGEGPDDTAITISYSFRGDKFLDLF